MIARPDAIADACCKRMAFDLNRDCTQHSSRFECPDALIYRAADCSCGRG
jgi:hypothetical protein